MQTTMNKIHAKASQLVLESMLASWVDAARLYIGEGLTYKAIADFMKHNGIEEDEKGLKTLYQIYYRYTLTIAIVALPEKDFIAGMKNKTL